MDDLGMPLQLANRSKKPKFIKAVDPIATHSH
jgi:hypothetical protein